MKITMKAAMLFGLALSFASPALAAPPDLGNEWRLTGQKKVRYFVADRDVNQTTSRTPVETSAVGTETEIRDLATRRERRDGKAFDVVDEVEQNGRRTADRRTEGRHVNTYANQEVNTYKVKITKLPFGYHDVSTWQERSNTKLASTYVDKTVVSWVDPFSQKQLASATETKVGPLTEYSYGSWRSRTSEMAAGGGEDLVATSRTLIKSRIDTSRTGSYLAAATDPGDQPLSPRTEIAYSEGGVRGPNRVSSLSQTIALTGAQKTHSKGQGKHSVDLAALLDAARAGQALRLNGKVAFKLGLKGESVVFVLVDGNCTPQTAGVALDPGSLEAASDGVEIRIHGISAGQNGRLVLAGKFRQAYLAKDGKGHVLTAL